MDASDLLLSELDGYRQMNIMSSGGSVEAKISSKGKLAVIGKISGGEPICAADHDKKKKHILYEGRKYDFLVALGVSDSEGKIFDRHRAKFRQIDRFLQYIEDIYSHLPKSEELYVLDLCCGKSYLTFAAYWFLTEIKGRRVRMTGADLKADVIGFCSQISSDLGYDGLSFECCDITRFVPIRRPDMVLSLHACDIATDIVLTTAAKLGAEVILSTPCCHHQMFSQLGSSSELGRLLAPVMEHSLLKQKVCVALTDALRCKRLEASGYSVDVTELIDPENTPKNLMIRAVKTNIAPAKLSKHQKELAALEALCGVHLYGGE